MIQIKIQKPKMNIFELFLYGMKFPLMVFLPIKPDSGNKIFIKIANIILIIFYIAFVSVLISLLTSSF